MSVLVNSSILPELLAGAGIGNAKGNSKSFVLTCPRCGKKDKLYIRKRDGRFVCWVCKERDGFQGAAEYALTEITGKTVAELKTLLYGEGSVTGDLALDLDLQDYFDEVVPLGVAALPEVMEHPDFRELDSEWGVPGAAYLENRGVPLDVALQYDIRYWPAMDRVVFPVKSKGKLLGWQSRLITPDEFLTDSGDLVKIPKALTYVGLAKDRALMFADRIDGDHAIITEGPMDAIKAHLCGGNVAALGKAVSATQLNLLRQSGIQKLYIGLDPDASDEIHRIVREMNDIELYDMRATGEKDLGAMTFEQVYDLYRGAKRVNTATLFVFFKDWYGGRP